MNGYFSQAGSFLVSTLIGIYVVIVLLRFLFQLVRADFNNPLSQFIIKITNPVLVPIRRFIPGIYGLDMSSLLFAYLLQALELFLITSMKGIDVPVLMLLWIAIGQVLALILYIFIIAIIIMAVISWVNPGQYSPVTVLLHQLTAPILAPVRKSIPPISGIDLSPLVVIIVLNLIVMLIPFIFG